MFARPSAGCKMGQPRLDEVAIWKILKRCYFCNKSFHIYQVMILRSVFRYIFLIVCIVKHSIQAFYAMCVRYVLCDVSCFR